MSTSESLIDKHHTPQNIALYAYGIGIVTGIGSMLICSAPVLVHPWFGVYLIALSVFHFLEYYITAIWNPPKLNIQAFCIPHSPSYVYAFLASILEYTLFSYWINNWTGNPSIQWLRWLGLFFILLGQSIRTLAMIQASTNFSHHISFVKETHHQLVRNGVYAILRHPAYFGFFWRSLGMQLVLLNPICFVGYVWILHGFFKERIFIEETLLVQFFGKEYEKYKTTTWIGIPWI